LANSKIQALKNILILFFLFGLLINSQAQCNQANPFCTGTNYSFPNSTNVQDLGSVGCLGSSPNPVWYFMEIDQNGPMTISISQQTAAGSGIDVDFALWGPYNSLAAGCGGGTFPVGSAIDCSYSPAAQETAVIPNARPPTAKPIIVPVFICILMENVDIITIFMKEEVLTHYYSCVI
jgi:hypothetical protein